MKLTKIFTLSFKRRICRNIAVFVAVNMMIEALLPLRTFALTGGPSQPEVQSFEPVGTSDMVDLFSGDFNYNIPLMDVDGYPINISYHSGITMDQEASWVGLGWNINPGVINRGMRGIPDDFNGEKIKKEFNMKENKTFGLNTGVGIELFGTSKLKLGLGYSIGIRYNNYNGIGVEQSLNLSLSAGEKGSSPLSGGLGITSSSDEGLSLQPSLSLSKGIAGNDRASVGLGLSVGSSFNSRGGLKALTVSANVSVQVKNGSKKDIEQWDGSEKQVEGKNSYGKGASATFDFGMPTYTPQVTLPMENLSITGNFKLGFEAWGIHPNFTIGGYYSRQKLAKNEIENAAYGYMNSENGEKDDNAILDFNREKDGAFTPSTPVLPVTNFTFDIYSVSGQGVGGSYRPFRSDIGHVFDATASTTSDGYSIGAEVGLGNIFHAGIDVTVTSVNTTSKRWNSENQAASRLAYRESTGEPLYEKFYFKEANEKSVDSDPAFFASMGNADVKSIHLAQQAKFSTVADASYEQGGSISSQNYRAKREKRNQSISFLTREEVDKGFGLQDASSLSLYSGAKPYHIAEITTLRNDGARYVYGIAAYNTTQEEVTFAVGGGGNSSTGLVEYDDADNSSGNEKGLDHYFSRTTLPPYAHSYLLTAVLSPDYVDSENDETTTKGPSNGDLGSYTKFNYTKIEDYKWRVPVTEDTKNRQATFNEGLKSKDNDNKANYIYGKKELRYLESIETKNYKAVFTLEDRNDGYGVADDDGKRATNKPMKLLSKISLYSIHDLRINGASAIPIKEVHFVYDYSLCPNVGNNSNAAISTASEWYSSNTNDGGKLTLRKIFFTYQNSNKARLSPYEFTYSASNPGYNIKGYDRWGNYKPNNSTLPPAEYPYVEQDKATTDQYAQAWSLTEIDLPSGGKITMDYESDDYAYVQNKRAGQMFKITGTDGSATDISNPTTKFYFDLQPGYTDIADYVAGIKNLYFRFLMNIKSENGAHEEYVSGYAQIANYGTNGSSQGWIQFKDVPINDKNGIQVCPITKAAIQFGRLNLPKLVWDNSGLAGKEDASFGEDLLKAIINSSFVRNISDAIKGPNKALYDKGVGKEAVMNKSWIRLNNPNKKKLGGGVRVKKISITDEWSDMTDADESSFSYGQEYTYTNEDGTSSGVAAYEPQLGGDENPWKQPVYFSEDKLLAPDDEHYMEEPFGESFFPSPGVGYGRVTVTNLQYGDVKRHATGYVVHEFYTAKDFPTITNRTSLEPDVSAVRKKSNPVGLSALLHIDVKDYMTASQGYVVELNDMHGKPKKQSVYQEGAAIDEPITSVEYKYKQSSYLTDNFRLDNNAKVIYDNGNVSTAPIGVFFDAVSDMRESVTETESPGVNGNLDFFFIPPFLFIPVPIILPAYASEKNQFRSAVFTKVIQRFGIMEETVAKDLGSSVSTKNLAYDAETGDVLLTQTTTDFNDTVYSLKYPAYWYYGDMGPAYKNIGYSQSLIVTAGTASVSNASDYFSTGDELAWLDGTKGWVTEVTASSIHVVKKDGTNVDASGKVKIIRSGRRNQTAQPMATLTTLSNPINNIKSNIYENVLQASAIELTNGWRTFCECYTSAVTASTNPYILGTKGLWKQKRSYLHLSGRTQDNYNNNTNIRRDGAFTSYTPFYKLSAGKWEMDPRNWTFTSEVTEFSPYGPELENRDALGRYSAATYGYNQTLPTAVAANARYTNIAVDNFEDYDFNSCADIHFKFTNSAMNINKTESHTGSRSIKVGSSPVTLIKEVKKCDETNSCQTKFSFFSSQTSAIRIISGTPPYSFDWTVINGSPIVNLASAGDRITVDWNNTDWELEVKVTDANGCWVIKKFYYP